MRIRNVRLWPLPWVGSYAAQDNFPEAGDGVLKSVHVLAADRRTPARIKLVREWKEMESSVVLAVDPSLLNVLYEKLSRHRGQPIREIESLVIDP